jgi:hypothetical protein
MDSTGEKPANYNLLRKKHEEAMYEGIRASSRFFVDYLFEEGRDERLNPKGYNPLSYFVIADTLGRIRAIDNFGFKLTEEFQAKAEYLSRVHKALELAYVRTYKAMESLAKQYEVFREQNQK